MFGDTKLAHNKVSGIFLVLIYFKNKYFNILKILSEYFCLKLSHGNARPSSCYIHVPRLGYMTG